MTLRQYFAEARTIFTAPTEHSTPIDRNAASILMPTNIGKLTDFTEADCEKWQWKGLIERCMRCGGRSYHHGWCFGCGKSG